MYIIYTTCSRQASRTSLHCSLSTVSRPVMYRMLFSKTTLKTSISSSSRGPYIIKYVLPMPLRFLSFSHPLSGTAILCLSAQPFSMRTRASAGERYKWTDRSVCACPISPLAVAAVSGRLLSWDSRRSFEMKRAS